MQNNINMNKNNGDAGDRTRGLMCIKNVNQFKLLFSQPCTWSSIYVQVNECAKWSDRFSKLVNGDSKLILFHKTLIVLIGL